MVFYKKKPTILLVAIACLLLTFAGLSFAPSLTETSQADFAEGTTNRTTVGADGNVSLALSDESNYYSDGNFTSQPLNTGSGSTAWSSLSWSEFGGYGEGLPRNQEVETDANMSGNVLLYHLNDGSGATSFTDSSGQGHNASCTGGSCPTWTADGKLGGAFSPDGLNDYIKTTDVIVSSPSELTISSWFIKESGGSTYECVLHHATGTTIGSSSYWMGVDNSDQLTATIGASTGGIGWAAGQTSVVAEYGRWYHLVASWNGTVVKVYIDGQYIKQYNLGSYNSILYPTRLGASSDGSNYRFRGVIDEVAIWTRSLSEEEILNLYKRGVLRLRLQASTCDESNCSDANFVGPDGTANTFFSDGNFAWDLNAFDSSQYFQYKAFFETDDTIVARDTTPYLLDVTVDYTITNFNPDLNVVKIDGFADGGAMPAFSYYADGNLTIDFNVLDTENDRLTVDINYSTSNTQGTGTVLVQDLNLSQAVCPSVKWDSNTAQCSWDWNIFGRGDANYFILIDVNDGELKTFEATDNSFMVDNNAPVTSWDGNHDSWQSFDANIRLTCSDPGGSGCLITSFRQDSDKTNAISWGSWQTYDSSAGVVFRGDGNWAIDFNSMDNAGNVGDTNSFFVLVGPHGRLRTFKENKPRSFVGANEKITLRHDVNLGIIPKVTITDSNGVLQINNQLMVDATVFGADYNTYDFNFDVNGAVGWYDVKIGSQLFEKAFYQSEVWQNRYTSNDNNTLPFSFDLNVQEPNLMQRWFEPVDVLVDFNSNATESSVRVLDYNGTNYLEIPSQIYNKTVSGSYITRANLVFLASIDQNETKNYFVTYSTIDLNKTYSTDLNTIQTGFLFDFNNSFFKITIDLNKGGTILKIKSKTGSNSDTNGNNPMQLSPELLIDPTAYRASSYTNPSFSQETAGLLVSKLLAKGAYSAAMDFNISYTAYAKTHYILVDVNVGALSDVTWDHYIDVYRFMSPTLFSRFSRYSDGSVSTFDLNTENTTWSMGDVNFLTAFDKNSLNSIGEIFLEKTSSETISVSTEAKDRSTNVYWKRTLFSGIISKGSYFNSRTAITTFNPWNEYADLNETMWKLEHPLTVLSGQTLSSDSIAPMNQDINYSPFVDTNDSADLNIYSHWGDNIMLDYVDINVSGPNLDIQTSQSVRDVNAQVELIVDANILTAGVIDCNFRAFDIAGNHALASISLRTSDFKAPNAYSHTTNPDTNIGIDPLTTVTVDANVNEYSGMDSVILYTRKYNDSNSSWYDWNAITMQNDQNFSDYNYGYTAPFTTPDTNSRWQYKIYTKDVNGYDSNTSTIDIFAYWEWTWSLTPGVFGIRSESLDTSLTVGDFNIINTGDKTLNFKITSNWDNKNQIAYSGNTETASGYSFPLASGSTKSLTAVLTTKTTEKSDDLNITINPSDTLANLDENYITATILSLAGGPFLYLEWSDTNTSVMQEDTSVTYTAKITNAGNMDANQITQTWTLPANWTITTGSASTTTDSLIINDYIENTIIATIGATATTGSQTITFTAGCCSDENKTKTSTQTVTVQEKPAAAVDDDDDDDTPAATAPLAPAAAVTIYSGGSPFSTTQQKALFQSVEMFEVTIGTDQRFAITIKNPAEGSLKNVKISVEGLLSKYLKLTTNEIGELAEGESVKIYTEITSPEYFAPGKHTLTYIITGTLVAASGKETPFTETRSVILMIHETSRLQALNYVDQVEQIRLDMEQKGYKTENLEKWERDTQLLLQDREYDKIKKVYKQAQQEQDNANNANQLLKKMENQLRQAQAKQIPTPNTTRLINMATRSFNRGEYATALENLQEAQLTYAVETKGEFNIQNFLTTKWQQITTLSTILFVIFYFFRLWVKWGLIKRKLEKIQTEEALLLELIKDTQRRCFIDNKISMGEYYDSLKQFEEKLSQNIETTAELQSKKNNLFRFKPTIVRLKQEKNELLGLIKQTQSQYFKEGIIETRIYQTKMRSFTERLSKIEKNIVLKQAKIVLRQQTGWQKTIWKTIYKIWK